MTNTRSDLPKKVAREFGRAKRRYVSLRTLRATLRVVTMRLTNTSIRTVKLPLARLRFRNSPLFAQADTLCLIRIIGNDLEPRHRKGQSHDNVEFILDNEAEFPNTKKFWLVNRIIDPEALTKLIDLLEHYRQDYRVIAFDVDDYRRLGWDLDWGGGGGFRFTEAFPLLGDNERLRFENAIRRHKNIYIMNNNGARNLALAFGRSRAKWVLPWDGNSFLTCEGFDEIRAGLKKYAYIPYFLVPMTRISENQVLLENGASIKANEEPQIVFRSDTGEIFDEQIPYGRRSKVNLLWRLAVPGIWNRFSQEPWDRPLPRVSRDRGLFKQIGWVARLTSGRTELEVGRTSNAQRAIKRNEAIKATIDRVDQSVVEAALDAKCLMFYDEVAITELASAGDDPTGASIRDQAELALRRGPYSVVDKTTVAASGDRHDYFSPAPYWWPDPSSETGLPFISKDGERVPGLELYGSESGNFDRTRLQFLFDDTLTLALAWAVFGDRRYAEHGACLVRTWFLDERTRMNPHLVYAQIRAGHNDNKGVGRGLIEFKDVYWFLDAIRLIERSEALTPNESADLRSWFTSYANWLDADPAAIGEFNASNNHGVFFDVQRAAIAGFLGDGAALSRIRLNCRERLHGHFAEDGSLPAELARTRPRHYVMFTLQGWTALARLMSSIGDDLWGYRTADGRNIGLGLAWLGKAMTGGAWPVGIIEEIDPERLAPLMRDLATRYPDQAAPSDNRLSKNIFHPGAAIAPYPGLWRP